MKLKSHCNVMERGIWLEIKRISITRLKPSNSALFSAISSAWNQKNLDYEIETACFHSTCPHESPTWNQKNLDYEIETDIHVTLKAHFHAWNQKNLDYEIETFPNPTRALGAPWLEIKRISITRLKQWCGPPHTHPHKTWNQKNLDYEIETSVEKPYPDIGRGLKSKESRLRDWNFTKTIRFGKSGFSWNQKNLDYEIETLVRAIHIQKRVTHLKSKESRLRDWNFLNSVCAANTSVNLKSKESRLRDWNRISQASW